MTRSSPPRVSVITPAYNASTTVAQAVASVLAQSVEDLEVIVVDDGSSEPIAAALAEIDDRRLRILRTDVNRGVSAARNTALTMARAPLIAQLDADDFWRLDHLEGVLPALEDPTVGLVYTNAEIVGSPLVDRAIATREPGDGLPDWLSDRSLHPVDELARLYRVNPIPSPAAVMRTAAVRAVGGYPLWLTSGEEYYLYIKLRRAGWRFAYVDRASAVYRWPQPGRGVSFDRGHAVRQNLKLFAVLALRSPREAAIFARLGAELVNLATLHAPATVPLGRRVRAAARRVNGR
jgi:glycosyltransferase involved in cell wall biosynthesis